MAYTEHHEIGAGKLEMEKVLEMETFQSCPITCSVSLASSSAEILRLILVTCGSVTRARSPTKKILTDLPEEDAFKQFADSSRPENKKLKFEFQTVKLESWPWDLRL